MRHVGPKLLAELVESSPRGSGAILCELLDHLSDHCPECQAGREAMGPRPSAPEPATEDLLPYRPVVARVVRKLARIARLAAGEPKTALGLVAEFLDRSAEERWKAVFESRRLLSPRVVARLLAYSRDDAASCGDSPEELARLALALVDRLELADAPRLGRKAVAVPPALVDDLRAECWALLARELMAAGALGAADFVLRSAEELLRQGTGDPLVGLRVCQVRAFWFWKVGRREDAQRALESLVSQAGGFNQPREEAELLLWQGHVCAARGDMAAGQALQREGMARVPEDQGSELLQWTLALKKRLGLI